jgi:hypothetical protein
MEKIVPAVGSAVTGFLGIAHLPRLYVKAILKNSGLIADGWNSGYRGMDSWLMDDLGISFEPFFAFLATYPTYAETEAWVSANATKLDPASVAAHNRRILTFNMPDQNGEPRRAALGITDESVKNGVLLNDLDDWQCLHAAVVAAKGSSEPIVPMISCESVGLLGIKHLARMWIKGVIHGSGLLPDQWRSGPVRVVYENGKPTLVEAPGGVDAMTCENLGLDLVATTSYLRDEQPTYPEFEAYVSTHATKLDPASIAKHHAGPWFVKGEKPAAELARVGYPGREECPMFLYNDLGDWDALRAQALAHRP